MVLEQNSPSPLIQIVLRQPNVVRGSSARGVAPSYPLLPVFFAGEENRFPAFVCGAPESADGFPDLMATMGPLLLVGPGGSGKSALANHLAAKLVDQLAVPGKLAGEADSDQTLLMPAIDFARLYARAVDADDIAQFRIEIQSAAVLVLDDVHLLIDKAAAQEELAARLEARTSAGLPTILTCRRLPTQVPGLRPLLVSRMLPGLTVPIRLPGAEAQRAIVETLVTRRDFIIDQEGLDLLCAGLPAETAARQLEAAVRFLELWCRTKATAPTMIAIRDAIDAIEPKSEITIDQVAKVIARRFKLKLSELKSTTRRQEVVRARSLAMYLARQLNGNSYEKIGRYFGNRDHTTVLHACRKTQSQVLTDSELRNAVDEVGDQLKASA